MLAWLDPPTWRCRCQPPSERWSWRSSYIFFSACFSSQIARYAFLLCQFELAAGEKDLTNSTLSCHCYHLSQAKALSNTPSTPSCMPRSMLILEGCWHGGKNLFPELPGLEDFTQFHPSCDVLQLRCTRQHPQGLQHHQQRNSLPRRHYNQEMSYVGGPSCHAHKQSALWWRYALMAPKRLLSPFYPSYAFSLSLLEWEQGRKLSSLLHLALRSERVAECQLQTILKDRRPSV